MWKQENVHYLMPFNWNLFNDLVWVTSISTVWGKKEKKKKGKKGGIVEEWGKGGGKEKEKYMHSYVVIQDSKHFNIYKELAKCLK